VGPRAGLDGGESRPHRDFVIISGRVLLRMRNVLDIICGENIKQNYFQ